MSPVLVKLRDGKIVLNPNTQEVLVKDYVAPPSEFEIWWVNTNGDNDANNFTNYSFTSAGDQILTSDILDQSTIRFNDLASGGSGAADWVLSDDLTILTLSVGEIIDETQYEGTFDLNEKTLTVTKNNGIFNVSNDESVQSPFSSDEKGKVRFTGNNMEYWIPTRSQERGPGFIIENDLTFKSPGGNVGIFPNFNFSPYFEIADGVTVTLDGTKLNIEAKSLYPYIFIAGPNSRIVNTANGGDIEFLSFGQDFPSGMDVWDTEIILKPGTDTVINVSSTTFLKDFSIGENGITETYTINTQPLCTVDSFRIDIGQLDDPNITVNFLPSGVNTYPFFNINNFFISEASVNPSLNATVTVNLCENIVSENFTSFISNATNSININFNTDSVFCIGKNNNTSTEVDFTNCTINDNGGEIHLANQQAGGVELTGPKSGNILPNTYTPNPISDISIFSDCHFKSLTANISFDAAGRQSLVLNGYSLSCTNNFIVTALDDFENLGGNTIQVGGDLYIEIDGDMNGSSEWFLNVTGSPIISAIGSGQTLSNCNASLGSEVSAYGFTTYSGNTNVNEL